MYQESDNYLSHDGVPSFGDSIVTVIVCAILVLHLVHQLIIDLRNILASLPSYIKQDE